jgi:hypothetical protein
MRTRWFDSFARCLLTEPVRNDHRVFTVPPSVAKGGAGTGIDDLNAFAKSVTCERLGAQIVAAVDKFQHEAAARAASMPNSPQLVAAAQTQLVRLGC